MNAIKDVSIMIRLYIKNCVYTIKRKENIKSYLFHRQNACPTANPDTKCYCMRLIHHHLDKTHSGVYAGFYGFTFKSKKAKLL